MRPLNVEKTRLKCRLKWIGRARMHAHISSPNRNRKPIHSHHAAHLVELSSSHSAGCVAPNACHSSCTNKRRRNNGDIISKSSRHDCPHVSPNLSHYRSFRACAYMYIPKTYKLNARFTLHICIYCVQLTGQFMMIVSASK